MKNLVFVVRKFVKKIKERREKEWAEVDFLSIKILKLKIPELFTRTDNYIRVRIEILKNIPTYYSMLNN